MERNAIQEFVDNLTIEKDITKDEAIDLKETLELNAKDIEPSRIANFIKSVQERMDATASDIFSGNGINIESVKLIAERAAKEIKIEQREKERLAKIEKEKLEEAKALAEKLAELSVTLKIKAGDGGRVFGSVSTKQDLCSAVDDFRRTEEIGLPRHKLLRRQLTK